MPRDSSHWSYGGDPCGPPPYVLKSIYAVRRDIIFQIHKKTTAPSVATSTEDKFTPPAPAYPRSPAIQPPTIAPTTPISSVASSPPRSGPGDIILASQPAISPTTIQARKLTSITPLCSYIL